MAGMSKLSEGEGNANLPLVKRKQNCYWKCNYHLRDEDNFSSIFEQIEGHFRPICAKYIFSEEHGKTGKTPHIEGYMVFDKKIDFNAIQKLFKFSDLQGSCKKNCQKAIEYCLKEGNRNVSKGLGDMPKPIVKMTYDKLKVWQREIANLFVEDEDPLFGRKVYWFWEKNGNIGKSILCKYMIDQMGAFVVQGKNNDILCGISGYIEKFDHCPRMVVFDIPRVNDNHVSYQAIESLKNGYFFSGKYESGMCRFNSPHVIIFSNEEPEMYNLTSDRWIVRNLDDISKDKGTPLSSENKE